MSSSPASSASPASPVSPNGDASSTSSSSNAPARNVTEFLSVTSNVKISVVSADMTTSEFSVCLSFKEECEGTLYSLCYDWLELAQDYSAAHGGFKSFGVAPPDAAGQANDAIRQSCVLLTGSVTSSYWNYPLVPLYTKMVNKGEAQVMIADLIFHTGAFIESFEWAGPSDNASGDEAPNADLSAREGALATEDARLKGEDARLKGEDARLKEEDAMLQEKDARLKKEDARLKEEAQNANDILSNALNSAKQLAAREEVMKAAEDKLNAREARLIAFEKQLKMNQGALNRAQINLKKKVESLQHETGIQTQESSSSESDSETEGGSGSAGVTGTKRKKGNGNEGKGRGKKSKLSMSQGLRWYTLSDLQRKYTEVFNQQPGNRCKNDKEWLIGKILEKRPGIEQES